MRSQPQTTTSAKTKSSANEHQKVSGGKLRIIAPNGDPGTLSVAMKLNAAVTRLVVAQTNVQNGMSFMEVQDGMLQTAGRIVNRMAELKGMASQDPMKSAQDIQSYDNEFALIYKFNSIRSLNKPSMGRVSSRLRQQQCDSCIQGGSSHHQHTH